MGFSGDKDESVKHVHTPDIVCPFCGYAVTDPWNYDTGADEDWGVMDCPECDKRFQWQRNVITTYSTNAPAEQCKDCEFWSRNHCDFKDEPVCGETPVCEEAVGRGVW